jgi:hypothetical protein
MSRRHVRYSLSIRADLISPPRFNLAPIDPVSQLCILSSFKCRMCPLPLDMNQVRRLLMQQILPVARYSSKRCRSSREQMREADSAPRHRNPDSRLIFFCPPLRTESYYSASSDKSFAAMRQLVRCPEIRIEDWIAYSRRFPIYRPLIFVRCRDRAQAVFGQTTPPLFSMYFNSSQATAFTFPRVFSHFRKCIFVLPAVLSISRSYFWRASAMLHRVLFRIFVSLQLLLSIEYLCS